MLQCHLFQRPIIELPFTYACIVCHPTRLVCRQLHMIAYLFEFQSALQFSHFSVHCVVQTLPDQKVLQERLAQEGLDGLSENAKLRFLRVMKKHKHLHDEEGDNY